MKEIYVGNFTLPITTISANQKFVLSTISFTTQRPRRNLPCSWQARYLKCIIRYTFPAGAVATLQSDQKNALLTFPRLHLKQVDDADFDADELFSSYI